MTINAGPWKPHRDNDRRRSGPLAGRGIHFRPSSGDGVAPTTARIGPNALIQTLRSLEELHGPGVSRTIAADAQCPHHPAGLVEEAHFVRLIQAMHRHIGPDRSVVVLAGAGRRTGEYVRANRIPRLVAGMLPHLPIRLGLRLLLKAFDRNAWTFVGSGSFRWSLAGVPELCIDDCITCSGFRSRRPLGSFYCGAFESLIGSLVDIRIGVTEEECVATGGRSCRFRIHLPVRSLAGALSPIPRTAEAPCASC